MTIKLDYKLDISAREIAAGIDNEIRNIIFKSIPRLQRVLNDKVGDIVFNKLIAGVPPITGRGLAEIGVPDINDRIQSVIRVASNNFRVRVSPAKYLRVDINILDTGYSELFALPEAVYAYTSINGGGILPWLKWLLVEGNGTVVDGWTFTSLPSRFSRTGGGIMAVGGSWNIPPELAGNPDDNILTRALVGIEKDLELLVEQQFQRLIK